MGFFSSDFYNTVEDQMIVGMLQGAFTYEPVRMGAVKRACNLVITKDFLFVIYDSVINGAQGIFGFSSIDNFKSNINNSKVIVNGNQTVAQIAPDPKDISQAIPFEKIQLISIIYFKVGGEILDDYRLEVGMIRLKVDGKFLGVRENMIFTQSQFDNVVNLFQQTALSGKMEIKREVVATSLNAEPPA